MANNNENGYDYEEMANERDRRRAAKETNSGERKALWALVAIVAAIIIFVVLTIIQRNIVNAGDKVSVIVANKEVPAGVLLTQESITQFFTMELRLKDEVPANAFTSGHQIVGMITNRSLSAKEVLTSNALKAENPYEGIDDPVELSIDVSKLSHAVSGSLRAGDHIDIKVVVDMSYLQQDDFLEGAGGYTLEGVPNLIDGSVSGTENDSTYSDKGIDTLSWRDLSSFDSNSLSWSATGKFACIPVASNVRVIDVYTAAGEGTAQLESAGTTQIATVFTIVVPRSMQDLLFLSLEEGTLEISRIVPEDEIAAAVEMVNPSNGTGTGTESSSSGQ